MWAPTWKYKGKGHVTYKGRLTRITLDISIETMKDRRSGTDILQTLGDHRCKPRLLYPAKLSITINGENKIFLGKIRFKQYVFINPAQEKVLERKPQPKEANCTHKNTGN